MLKSNPKIKRHSNRTPLTLHQTGQYCKKIRGKLYYFGNDKELALKRYYEQAVYLHTGKGSIPSSKADENSFSIKYLCNLYLEHQRSRAAAG